MTDVILRAWFIEDWFATEGMMKKGYRVTLTDEEQQELRSVVNSGKAEGKKDRHNSRGNLFGVVPNCRSNVQTR